MRTLPALFERFLEGVWFLVAQVITEVRGAATFGAGPCGCWPTFAGAEWIVARFLGEFVHALPRLLAANFAPFKAR